MMPTVSPAMRSKEKYSFLYLYVIPLETRKDVLWQPFRNRNEGVEETRTAGRLLQGEHRGRATTLLGVIVATYCSSEEEAMWLEESLSFFSAEMGDTSLPACFEASGFASLSTTTGAAVPIGTVFSFDGFMFAFGST